MIHWTLNDGVGTAVLDRPERRNALDVGTVDELVSLLGAPGEEAPIVILTGTGTTFCSGFDLSTRGEGATFKERVDGLFEAILQYPAPVIAALNGPAVGMGAVLAATCDLRIGGPTTWFEIPAAKLDVVLDVDYLGRVRSRVGLPAAQLLFVGSRRIEPADALRVGLLHAIHDDAVSEAVAWAERVRGFSARSLASHKAMLNDRWTGA